MAVVPQHPCPPRTFLSRWLAAVRAERIRTPPARVKSINVQTQKFPLWNKFLSEEPRTSHYQYVFTGTRLFVCNFVLLLTKYTEAHSSAMFALAWSWNLRHRKLPRRISVFSAFVCMYIGIGLAAAVQDCRDAAFQTEPLVDSISRTQHPMCIDAKRALPHRTPLSSRMCRDPQTRR